MLRLRLLLAALLVFGSEIIFWADPLSRPPTEWLLTLAGYLALAAVLLDLADCARIADLPGLMTLAGLYSLGAALVIWPNSAFADVPRTLVTRVMGAHTLLATLMLLAFLGLTRRRRQTQALTLAGCALIGLFWGLWMQEWPALAEFPPRPFTSAWLLAAAVLLVIILLAGLPLRRADPPPESTEPPRLRLSLIGWLLVASVLIVLAAFRYLRGEFRADDLPLVALLALICAALLYFRRRATGRSLIDPLSRREQPPTRALLLGTGLLLFSALLTAALPPPCLGSTAFVTLVGLGFTAYGLSWLPLVSLIVGLRGALRQLEGRRL
ncbi:MAG: hypothetical protein JNM70_17340 [Anaerolineae bacterium]|nr:hypothetical protein [Anaerolineae bacterium]